MINLKKIGSLQTSLSCDIMVVPKVKALAIIAIVCILAIVSLQNGRFRLSKFTDHSNKEIKHVAQGGINVKDHRLPYSTCHQTYTIERTSRRCSVNVTKTYNYSPEEIPLHALSQDEPYKSRLMGIKDRCDKFKDKFKFKIDLSRFIFDHVHKVAMCVVPKDACTTWKRLMMFLAGKATLESKERIPLSNLDLASSVTTLAKLSTEKAQEILNTYTTFMVTRHPFERLVSAYNSKFHGRPDVVRAYRLRGAQLSNFLIHVKYPQFSRMRRYYKSNVTALAEKLEMSPDDLLDAESLHSSIISGEISFKHFVQALGRRPMPDNKISGIPDPHWRQQYALCNPCAIDYDYIINFESLSLEGERLLTYAQQNNTENEERAHFPIADKKPVNESFAKALFHGIDAQDIKRIETLYKNDFYLFNYDSGVF